MKDILIIGYGVVGHNLHKEIQPLHPDVYDIKYRVKPKNKHYDFSDENYFMFHNMIL